MVGAAPIHALAPVVYLQPLLVELGATVPARALYVAEPDITRPLISAALASNKEE